MLDQCHQSERSTLILDSGASESWERFRRRVLAVVEAASEEEGIARVLYARDLGLHDSDIRWLLPRDAWKRVPATKVGRHGRPPASSARVLPRKHYRALQHLLTLIDGGARWPSKCPVEMFHLPAAAIATVVSTDISTRRLWHLYAEALRHGVWALHDTQRDVPVWTLRSVKCPETVWNRHDKGFARWKARQFVAETRLVEFMRIDGP